MNLAQTKERSAGRTGTRVIVGVALSLMLACLGVRPFAAAELPRAVEDLQEHAEQLRTKLKGRPFTVLIETPFVIVGDEPEPTVRERAQSTVRVMVDLLKQDYFARDPEKILEIWLFKDELSYRKHAKEFFNDEPDTPYD